MAEFAIVTQAAITAGGPTQDFTVSGFGTPKGAIFILTYGTALGTAVDSAGICVGATDGTRGKAIWNRIQDNVVATGSYATNHESTTGCIVASPTTSDVRDTLAAFDSWITDGVRISWSDLPPAAYQVTCILFGGSGISDLYVDWSELNVKDASVTCTVGFPADVVLMYSHSSSFNDTSNTNANCLFGVALNDGASPPTQHSMNFGQVNSNNPTVVASLYDTNSSGVQVSLGSGRQEAEVNSFTATGFNVTTRVLTPSADHDFWFMAIKFNGLSTKLLNYSTPTSGGNQTINSVGFTPQFGLMGLSACTANDTYSSDETGEVFGIGAFTAATQVCHAITSDDNVATTNSESVSHSRPIYLRKNAGVFMDATFSSFNSDGAVLNFGTADGTARKGWALFVSTIVDHPITATGSSYAIAGQGVIFRVGSPLYLRYRK